MTRVAGWQPHPLYEEVISRTEIDPFERPDDFIAATKKHNQNRKALKEVADEHLGPDNS